MIPKVIEIQEAVTNLLISKNIYPMEVFYTFLSSNSGEMNGTLGLTFFTWLDLEEVLDLIDYHSMCDKSGILVFKETNSIILTSGDAILTLWSCEV